MGLLMARASTARNLWVVLGIVMLVGPEFPGPTHLDTETWPLREVIGDWGKC